MCEYRVFPTMPHGRVLLAGFLEKNGLNQADVARGTGIGTSLISNYMSDPDSPGHRSPGLAHAFAIEDWVKELVRRRLAKGQVPAKSWVNGKTRKRRSSRTRKAA